MLHLQIGCVHEMVHETIIHVTIHFQGGHGTEKTGNSAVNFSREGKHRVFKFNFLHRENCANTGKTLKI